MYRQGFRFSIQNNSTGIYLNIVKKNVSVILLQTGLLKTRFNLGGKKIRNETGYFSSSVDTDQRLPRQCDSATCGGVIWPEVNI